MAKKKINRYLDVYINNQQLKKILKKDKAFYLLFELSAKNRKNLQNVIQKCLDHTHCRGIVFSVNKNEILLDRLFFLRDVTLDFYHKGKRIGIWGVPSCIKMSIFGPQLFTELIPEMIEESSDCYCKNLPVNQYGSTLLLSCIKCIDTKVCDGLGLRKENQVEREYRTSYKFRQIGRDELYKTDSQMMKSTYESFRRYVDYSDLAYADRYLYFIKNIDYGSDYSFADRFVYHCDYLPYDEYEDELRFLDTQVLNKSFLSTIDNLARKRRISKIAYSKAVGDGVFRESFYVAPSDQYSRYLLHYFDIDINVESGDRLYGVGVDFYNGEIKSFKVYMMVRSEKLLRRCKNYIDKIGIDLLGMHERSHFHVLRLNQERKIVSDRIDLIYNEKDYLYFLPYFSQFQASDISFEKLYIFGLAFDFEDGNIKKINLYYRNRF